MKLAVKPLAILASVCLWSATIPAVSAQESEIAEVKEATEVLEVMLSIPEQSVPPYFFNGAEAIAILPSVIKIGFGIGGRYGTGVILVRNKETGQWSNPSFLKMIGGSFGFQAGGQATDIVLVFMNKRGLDSLVNGKFTLGADAAVAAGPVGRQAAAATDIQLKSEILSYSRNRGLFAGVSLEGTALLIDDSANEAFYKTPGITAGDLFWNTVPLAPPPVVKPLHDVLNSYK